MWGSGQTRHGGRRRSRASVVLRHRRATTSSRISWCPSERATETGKGRPPGARRWRRILTNPAGRGQSKGRWTSARKDELALYVPPDRDTRVEFRLRKLRDGEDRAFGYW